MITFEEFKIDVELRDRECDQDLEALAGLIEKEIDRKIKTMHKGKQRIYVTYIEELEDGTKYFAAFDLIIGLALREVEKRYSEAGWVVTTGDHRYQEYDKVRLGKYWVSVSTPAR